MDLDLRTVVVVSTVLTVMTWAAFFFVHERHDETDRPWLRLWAYGLLAQAMGWLLFSQRGHWPDVISVLLCNTLLMTSVLGCLRGLRGFFGEPVARWRDGGALLLGVVVTAIFLWVWPSDLGRITFGTFAFLALMGDVLQLVYRASPRPWPRPNLVMLAAFGLPTAVLVLRMVAQWLGLGTANALQPTVLQTLLFIITSITPLLATLGFVMMANARLGEELRAQATHDALTGLSNRRQIEAVASQWWSDGKTPVGGSLLMIDADHFKDVNDRHGHAVGDAVLCWLADRLRLAARDSDLVGRLGGEEFVMLLPGASTEQAAAAAERLREAIRREPFVDGDLRIAVTVSIGVAAGAGSNSLREALQRADAAMYRAKAAGRNRVELAD